MKLVRIPRGKFLMGSLNSEEGRLPEETQHEVEITQPYYLAACPVTQQEYQQVMGTNPSWFSTEGGGKASVLGLDTTRFPVESVSWEEAEEFCRRLAALPAEKQAGRTYRLPTEAEWEYACRAGTTTPFSYGPSLSSSFANFDGNNPYRTERGPYLARTAEVGSYQANGWDFSDMHGNVRQWCADVYSRDYYTRSPAQDPRNDAKGDQDVRVVRGGSWYVSGSSCRSASRSRSPAGARSREIGFRVACLVVPKAP